MSVRTPDYSVQSSKYEIGTRSVITWATPPQTKSFHVRLVAHTPECHWFQHWLYSVHRQSGMPRGFGLVCACSSVGTA